MPFIRRYRGGVFTQWANPPVFALFCFLFALFSLLDHQRPFQTNGPCIIVSWDRPSSEERPIVVNEQFLVVSCAASLLLASKVRPRHILAG